MEYQGGDGRVHYTSFEQAEYGLPATHTVEEFNGFAAQTRKNCEQREAEHSELTALHHEMGLRGDQYASYQRLGHDLTKLMALVGHIHWVEIEIQRAGDAQDQGWLFPPQDGGNRF